jgi:hypothetical protein
VAVELPVFGVLTLELPAEQARSWSLEQQLQPRAEPEQLRHLEAREVPEARTQDSRLAALVVPAELAPQLAILVAWVSTDIAPTLPVNQPTLAAVAAAVFIRITLVGYSAVPAVAVAVARARLQLTLLDRLTQVTLVAREPAVAVAVV